MRRARRTSGRESIWNYPRTPVVRPEHRRIQVIHADIRLADTTRARRICEMGHPPTYYLPPEDVRLELLEPTEDKSFSEWKGIAVHFDLHLDGQVVSRAGWHYPDPSRRFEQIRDFVAFYPHRIDACLVDDEQVVAEPRESYGGWITSELEGPFR